MSNSPPPRGAVDIDDSPDVLPGRARTVLRGDPPRLVDEELEVPDPTSVVDVESVDTDDVEVAGVVVEGAEHPRPVDRRPLEVGVAGVEGAAGLGLAAALIEPGHLDVHGVEAAAEGVPTYLQGRDSCALHLGDHKRR